MSKKALVINKEEFITFLMNKNNGQLVSDIECGLDKYVHLNGSDLLQFKPSLVERSICETDETTLQIIPYITLVHLVDDGTNVPDPEDKNTKFFVYTRGSVGNEGRLHGKCSLGLGGHIEEEPSDELSFDQVITNNTIQELSEEVGLVINNINSDITLTECGSLFLDFSNPVGRVHLGLSISLFINPTDLKETEAGIITKGRWLTGEEIIELSKKEVEPIIMEDWSKMYLVNNLKISL